MLKTMTEPTYEINREKLESLSIADLTGLIQMTLGENYWPNEKGTAILTTCVSELDKRINDIIIF